jgi:putative ABC transport system permease protein
LQRRLAAIPGVTSVGVISHLPYDDMPNWSLIYSLDASLPTGAPSADSRAISTGLFETLGVEIIDGRQFTDDDDDPKNAVVIIDDRLARDLWPSRSAVGQQFFTTVAGMNAAIGSSTARLTVVGVVPHLRLRSLVEDFRPQIFMPWRIARRNPMAYVIGTSRDPSTLVSEVRALVAALDARIAVYDVRAMETYVEQARSTRQFTMLLAAAFALVALTLTLVGIYGVLAYSIAHRRREIGVRRALGAGTGQVVREVVGEGMLFACLGGVGGLAGAAVAARWLQGQLYAVNPIDPLTYAVALGLILVGAALACSIPARRATAISPLEALRGQ